MTKGSDLLVAALENEGVDYVFGVPGEENLDVLESLRSSSIKLVLTRHEQGAAFMAATHGRLTGRPGVCMTTLGPGALNLTTGAAYAHLGAWPMIMITGQKGIMSSRQARFQIVDVVSAFKPLTKMSRQIVSTATIPTVVREAFRVAMEERPGPVLLELPEDIAGEKSEELLPIPVHPIEIPVAQRAALDRAAAMIMEAKRPLVMLGAAASRPRSTAGLAGFVRRMQIPYFTTQMGKGTVAGGSNALYGNDGFVRARLRARGDRGKPISSLRSVMTPWRNRPSSWDRTRSARSSTSAMRQPTSSTVYFPACRSGRRSSGRALQLPGRTRSKAGCRMLARCCQCARRILERKFTDRNDGGAIPGDAAAARARRASA